MGIQDQLEELKNLQKFVLEYIDKDEDPDNIEECFENLTNFIQEKNYVNNASKLKMLLYLIVNLSNNHHRSNNFFEKIERILNEYKNKIKQYYSNSIQFKIFKSNKRLLLFLIKEEMITLDQSIFDKITNIKYQKKKYPEHFAPEIKHFINEQNEHLFSDKEIFQTQPPDFEEKRLKGENGELICEIIQNDSKNEFINFVTQKKYPLNSIINESIYETNSFLIDKKPTLIEYAAFFGSIEIFEYLNSKNVEIEPSLWLYGVHSNNKDIINFLEQNLINENESKNHEKFPFKDSVLESIKCNHNEITDYIFNKYESEKTKKASSFNYEYKFEKYFVSFGFQYYNYFTFPSDLKNNDILFYLCLYDYTPIVKTFLSSRKIDIDSINILSFNIFMIL